MINRNQRGQLATFGLGLAVIGVMLVLTPALAAGKLTNVKVATSSNGSSFLALHVGVDEGFYKDAGLNVQVTAVGGGNTGIAALTAGSVQFYAGLPQSSIVPIAQGANIKMIMALTTKNNYEILAKPSITSLSDLKGKKVGILIEGNGTQTQQEWLLDKVGVGAKNVTWVAAGGTSARLAALVSGQVAATILNNPTDIIAQSQGFKVLARFMDYVPNFPQQVVVANESFLKAHPQEARTFVKATLEASNWIYAHPQEAAKVNRKWTKDSAEISQKSLENMISISQYSKTGKMSVAGLNWALDVARKYTTKKVPSSAASMIDTAFLP